MRAKKRVRAAVELVHQYGGIDGAHHKQWVLDQVMRALLGDEYGPWIERWQGGEDGPETYRWDTGIAP